MVMNKKVAAVVAVAALSRTKAYLLLSASSASSCILGPLSTLLHRNSNSEGITSPAASDLRIASPSFDTFC